MPLKPLTIDGDAFSTIIDLDHTVTSLITLPEGCFYSVEALVLDPNTGTPLRPLMDYMFFQPHVDISKQTLKQTAAIIQILNKSYSRVTVMGSYSHGVEQSDLDYWANLCISKKDVPGWMNWIGTLDAPFQQHPNMLRMLNKPVANYTLSEVQLEFKYIVDQVFNGDSNLIPHIEYWQNYLFSIPSTRLTQAVNDLTLATNNLKTNASLKVGDFKFTDNDGSKIDGPKNQFFHNLLVDRGDDSVGNYSFLPEGGTIPAVKTNLFQKSNSVSTISGLITLDKTRYKYKDTMVIKVRIGTFTNPPTNNSDKYTVQVLDMSLPQDSNQVYRSSVRTIVPGTEFTVSVPLKSITNETGGVTRYCVRLPEHMSIDPVFVLCDPDANLVTGYVRADLIGKNNIGQITAGGYVNSITADFTKVGLLDTAQKLYVHILGNFPSEAIDGNYPLLKEYTFNTDFTSNKDVTLIKFKPVTNVNENFYVNVVVSKSSDPTDISAITTQNLWYVSAVPINPYVDWYFAEKVGDRYNRITSKEEGNVIYLVGKTSVGRDIYPFVPNLTVTSSGIGAAIQGVDFVIDNTLITIDNTTIAYKITLPLKPEIESKYKNLSIRSQNSNQASVWIVDVSLQTDISGTWRQTSSLNSNVLDYVGEKSEFYLHLESNILSDGTPVTLVVESPTIYGNALTYPSQVTFFGSRAVAKFTLNAPLEANLDQYLKVKVYAPGRTYNVPQLLIVDTEKPYYEIRFVVNGMEGVINAYEGDNIQCQMRAIASSTANVQATVELDGSSDYSTGPNSDFTFPTGAGAILRSWSINSRDWTNILLSNVAVKTNLNSAYKTLIVGAHWSTVNGVKTGKDTSMTLNIRKIGT